MAELLKGAMMAINETQKGLSLSAFLRDYRAEEQCEAASSRRDGRVGSYAIPRARAPCEFKRRELRYWQCGACRHQTSLCSVALMEHRRLRLTKWNLAIYLTTQSKTSTSALAQMWKLGTRRMPLGCSSTRWMEVMAQREADHPADPDSKNLRKRTPSYFHNIIQFTQLIKISTQNPHQKWSI
jgi:hypothetical protein